MSHSNFLSIDDDAILFKINCSDVYRCASYGHDFVLEDDISCYVHDYTIFYFRLFKHQNVLF